MEYEAGSYDVAVVGAGHAGVEAALAAARLIFLSLMTRMMAAAAPRTAMQMSIMKMLS